MILLVAQELLAKYLTLTRVVFEYAPVPHLLLSNFNLTLTRVVFEFACLIGTAIAKAI